MTPRDFIAHFDTIAEAPNGIARLREFVLRLAVRGRLVPQNPDDEPATMLLDRISEEKERLVRDKEISKPKHLLPVVTQDQERTISCSNQLTENRKQTQSFELPSGWTWSNLKRLGRVCGGGTPSKKNPEFWSGDIPWISPKDMKVDFINRSQDMVTTKAIDRSSIKLIPSGALLMVVRGMILDHSFPVAVTEIEVTINQDMKALIPFDSRLSRYLLLLMKGMKMEILKLVKKSTHGTCRLTTDDLFSIALPIPPVKEQQRILSKVDDIVNVLDQFDLRLTAQRNAHDAFATSFLHHLST